jgi:hypothetical protein
MTGQQVGSRHGIDGSGDRFERWRGGRDIRAGDGRGRGLIGLLRFENLGRIGIAGGLPLTPDFGRWCGASVGRTWLLGDGWAGGDQNGEGYDGANENEPA